MNLIFVTEARFIADKNGDIYGDAACETEVWSRYLNVFDKIFIVARVDYNSQNIVGKYRSSGPQINFIPIPYYVGPVQYLLKLFQIKSEIKKVMKIYIDAAFICRVPGVLGDMVIKELKKNNKDYAIEVVGDPDDVFSDESFKHPLKSFFHKKTVQNLRQNISGAKSVLYVTKYTLQKKYPPKSSSFTTHASNVMLSSNIEVTSPKILKKSSFFKILSVGSLEQMYKAPDIVLKAIAFYNEKFQDLPIEFTWLGDGTFLKKLEAQQQEMKLNNFNFKGQVSSSEVKKAMKESDLFILASRTEGLPRVIIEAMAVGLPVIGTKVGGIPELLGENTMINKNDPEALAIKIYEILSQPDFYEQISKRNLKEAEQYDKKVLSARREEFYLSVKNQN